MPEIQTETVYRMRWPQRIAALAILAGGIAFLFGTLGGFIYVGIDSKKVTVVFLSAYVLIALWWMAKVFSARAILSPEWIEMRDLFGLHHLSVHAVRGRREYAVRGKIITRYLKLEPVEQRVPALEIQTGFNFDHGFYDRFYSLPDLDEADEEKKSILGSAGL